MTFCIWTWTGLLAGIFIATSSTSAQTTTCNFGFYLNTSPVSYDQASKTCRQQGGELAFPASAAQDLVLAHLLAQVRIADLGVWIGFNRKGVPGINDWVDEFGHRLTPDQLRWGKGEPNNAGGMEECGAYISGGSPGFNDRPCSIPMPFACWGNMSKNA